MSDRDWNDAVAVAAAVVFALILGFTIGASFTGGCAAIKDAPFGCAEWWLSRYQTLIGVSVALLAAWVAARPVWKQTRVALHEATSAREGLLAGRAEITLPRLRKFRDELSFGYEGRVGTGGKHPAL